jgi:hypothetical protein
MERLVGRAEEFGGESREGSMSGLAKISIGFFVGGIAIAGAAYGVAAASASPIRIPADKKSRKIKFCGVF